MKIIKLLILFCFVTGNTWASENDFRRISEEFSNCDAFIANELSKQTIRLYLRDKNLDQEDKTLLKSVDKLNFLSFEKNNSQPETNHFFESIEEVYQLESYTLFQFEKNKTGSKKIYIKENGDHISHFILMNNTFRNNSLVELKGKLYLEKMFHLGNLMNIDGLDVLNNHANNNNAFKSSDQANNTPSEFKLEYPQIPKTMAQTPNPNFKDTPRFGFRPWYIEFSNKDSKYESQTHLMVPEKNEVNVYNRYGQLTYKIKKGNEPDVIINGCQINKPMRDALALVSSDCIKNISVDKNIDENDAKHPNGLIEVKLKGSDNQAFVVCEGKLFFNQDSIMECIDINDPFAPILVFDCEKLKLKEIQNIEPEVIESIKFSNKDENCENIESGDYIVVRSK